VAFPSDTELNALSAGNWNGLQRAF
jgi:hypothetical protein